MGKKLKYKTDGKDKDNIGCGSEFNENKEILKYPWAEVKIDLKILITQAKTFEECLASRKSKTEDRMLGREEKVKGLDQVIQEFEKFKTQGKEQIKNVGHCEK